MEMQFFLTILLTIAILWAFQPLVIFLYMLFQLRKAPWRIPTAQIAGEDSLTDVFQRLSESLLDQLYALGFKKEVVLLESPLRDGMGPREGWILRREGDPHLALAGWQRGGSSAPAVTFHTPFFGGTFYSTSSGHPLTEMVSKPSVQTFRVKTHDPRLLLEEHQKRVLEAESKGLRPTPTTSDEFVHRLESAHRNRAYHLENAANATLNHVDNSWRPTWIFSLGMAFRMALHRKEIIKTERSAGIPPQDRARLREGNVITPPGSRPAPKEKRSWSWTLFTLVAFAIAQGFWLGWSAVPVFVAILVFHEAGHLAAMRIFGYKDVKVFFIPFLGALATAKSRPWGTAPWKRAVVSIAGPLPGIVAALVFFSMNWRFAGLFTHHPTLMGMIVEAGGMAMLLNLFNLLPLGDLDGGQYLQASLFSRFPRAEVFFRIAGSLGLAALALSMQAPFMTAFAILPLLNLRLNWEAAKIRHALSNQWRKAGSPPDRQTAEADLDHLMGTSPFSEIGDPRRGLVRQFVVRDLAPTPMPIWQSVLCVILYLLLWSPVVLFVATSWGWMLLFKLQTSLHPHSLRHRPH